jgi:hypothetical protein
MIRFRNRDQSGCINGNIRRWTCAALVLVAACGSAPMSPAGPAMKSSPATSASSARNGQPTPSQPTSPAAFVIDNKAQVGTADAHVDFYSWDGAFIRRITPWQLVYPSPDGRYYYESLTKEIWTTAGVVVGSLDQLPMSQWVWAGDGNYPCGTGKDSIGTMSLYWSDVQGNARQYPLSKGAQAVMGCSATTGRAVIEGDSRTTMTVISLADGHVENVVHMGDFNSGVVSPDARWIAVDTTGTSSEEIDVIDLLDGSVHARFPKSNVLDFAPDSKRLLIDDGTRISLVEWQTGTTLWFIAGHLDSLGNYLNFVSDPTTDYIIVSVYPGPFLNAPPHTPAYWIIGPSGTASSFVPQG